VLKGAPFERLTAKTYDDIAIEPVYGRDTAAQAVAGRRIGAPWQIIARIEHPDPAAANAQALQDLENGAVGLSLVFAEAVGAYGFGLDAGEASLARVLDAVLPRAGISLDLQPGPQPEALFAALVQILRRRSAAPQSIDLRFGLDPIGALATGRGENSAPWRDAAGRFAALIRSLAAQGFNGPFAVADARVIHDAGGSEAQELAYAMATALAYLRALEAGGIALEHALRMINFRLAADADQFLTTAKFRALRRLWSRIEEACGLDGRPVFIAAETAWRMMTRRDPFVNLLRTAVAVVAAGIGGADAITVLPYTAAIGLPDAPARRIARNTQLILLEESNLARVADPMAGSGAIESLTRQLCDAAWSLFQEIEKAGGVAAALASGAIQEKVAAVSAERGKAIARREDALTGTTEFADIAEVPVTVLAPSPLASDPSAPRHGSADSLAGAGAGKAQASHAPLPRHRLAEPFEALRDASDRHAERTGTRPKVFLANLGRRAEFAARSNYAANFFAAGGIQAVDNDGLADCDAIGKAFRASGAVLACLCSSDDVYAVEAGVAARALNASGARHLYLVGQPGDREEAFAAAGVGTFIHAGCDALAVLRAAHQVAGLAEC